MKLENLGDPHGFWTSTFVCLGGFLFLVVARLCISYKLSEGPQSGYTKPNYGIIMQPVVLLLWRFGFWIVTLQLIFGYLFLGIIKEDYTDPQDRKHLWLCNAFLSLQTIMWPIFFSAFVLLLLLNNILPRVLSRGIIRGEISTTNDFGNDNSFSTRTRTKWTGNEQVLLAGCFRGSSLVTVAKELREGSVTVCDPWNTEKVPFSCDWALENLRREGIPPSRVRILEQSFENPHKSLMGDWAPAYRETCVVNQYADLREIPMGNETIDLVVTLATSHIYPGEAVDDVAEELYRVLKPGGRWLHVRSFEEPLEDAMKSLGMTNFSKHFRITLPFVSFVVEAQKPRKNQNANANSIDIDVQPPIIPHDQKGVQPFEFIFSDIPSSEYLSSAAKVLLPLFSLFISLLIIAGLTGLLYVFWPDVDVPAKLSPKNYNRLGSGLLAPTLVWATYGVIEAFTGLYEECATCRINSTGQFFAQYFKLLFFAIVASAAFNGLFWLPSFIIDYYFAKDIGLPVNTLNIIITVVLITVGLKVKAYYDKYQTDEKRAQRASEKSRLLGNKSNYATLN